MAKAALVAEKLVKVFDTGRERLTVLRGVDLVVEAGAKIAIVGASGVGKTTFLHLLGTLDRPTSGRVLHFGQDVFALPEHELSRFRNQNLGFIFQFHHLLPEFNALENVMLPALIAGWSPSQARARAEEVLTQVGLGHRLTHQMGELSGGERQRVAIARAVVLRPPVILADEPTGNLDARTAQEVVELLLQVNESCATTLVVVTHNPELAARMDRVFGLMDGRLIELSRDEPWPWSSK